jgi:WD40 repeat protein
LSGLVSLQVAQCPCLRTLGGFDCRIDAVAFSPNGERLVAAGMDRVVKIWDTKTWQEVLTFRDQTGGILSVAFSPDGRRLATGGTDSTIKFWDAATGNLLRTLHGHAHWVSGVVFSPDGKRLASSSMDGTVKLWAAGPWPERPDP